MYLEVSVKVLEIVDFGMSMSFKGDSIDTVNTSVTQIPIYIELSFLK
jgi:hypothetical protein